MGLGVENVFFNCFKLIVLKDIEYVCTLCRLTSGTRTILIYLTQEFCWSEWNRYWVRFVKGGFVFNVHTHTLICPHVIKILYVIKDLLRINFYSFKLLNTPFSNITMKVTKNKLQNDRSYIPNLYSCKGFYITVYVVTK